MICSELDLGSSGIDKIAAMTEDKNDIGRPAIWLTDMRGNG